MGHEIGDSFQHALRLQDECRQRHSGQIHARTKLRDQAQQQVLHFHTSVNALTALKDTLFSSSNCSTFSLSSSFLKLPKQQVSYRFMITNAGDATTTQSHIDCPSRRGTQGGNKGDITHRKVLHIFQSSDPPKKVDPREEMVEFGLTR
jgi:hypothetical protein